MEFFDYAWATSFQITKKKHEDVKILVRNDVRFPLLGKDNYGYVICLPEPKEISSKEAEFQGLRLKQNDETHQKILWQLFRASVFHLSQHVATSGYDLYSKWSKEKDPKLALYVASLIEDAVVAAYAENFWSPFLPDVALANAIAYLRLKPAQVLLDDSLRVMTAILSQFTLRKIKGSVSKEMQNDVNEVVAYLQEIKDFAGKMASQQKEATAAERLNFLRRKLELADVMYRKLQRYGSPSVYCAMPHTENYFQESVYRNSISVTKDEFDHALQMAFAAMNSKVFVDDSCEREASQAFTEWKGRKEREQKIIASYKEACAETRFSAIEFPKEDYTEYLRSKLLLSSPIRRILEKLRLLKNVTGEDFKHESGFIDLQEAIQVVASQSKRTDIFVREELQTREEAWAVVIDASHSLNFFTGEVRGVALCLAETAKNLIPDRTSWGMFAFSDKFYIIKDFSENYSTRIRARIGGLKHGGLTYLADGLAMIKDKLRQHLEESKMIIVVSDFFPSGDDKIKEELKQSLRQIERAGFGLIGIGLKSRAVKDYLRVNCVVDSPYDLMKKFTKAFLEHSAS
ncbi:MAG: hypothetical protein QXJ02_03550 [Candidatus Bathyarchaeia archaeon]